MGRRSCSAPSRVERVQDFPSGLIQSLRGARHVVALTGSSISAESGVPTFREARAGLWERFHPQELAILGAFARDARSSRSGTSGGGS